MSTQEFEEHTYNRLMYYDTRKKEKIAKLKMDKINTEIEASKIMQKSKKDLQIKNEIKSGKKDRPKLVDRMNDILRSKN